MQLLHKGERGNNKYGSRQEELKQICIDLKDLAVTTGLPIVLGAQFNREVTNQLRLHATKIGEAGDIERVANLIVGFWNNDFEPLATDGEASEINRLGASTPGTLYAKILKQRGGRVGLTEVLSYNGNAGTITNSINSTSFLPSF
jgi:replicative DNA helicase